MPRPNGLTAQAQRALQTLGREHREITAVYLFGSQARGRAGPLSDLDIAVLVDEQRVSPQRLFRFRLDLMSKAARACHRCDVDVVLLNQATPLLAYEAVRAGRLLYEREHDLRVAFEARAIQHYLDLQPFYRLSRSYLKRQLLRSALHGQS